MDSYRTLEVEVISAEKLKQVSNPFSSKMNVYALVYISNDPKYEKLKERTRRDRTGGGCNPTWNSTFRFVVPAALGSGTTTGTGLSLHIVLRTGHGISDRDVGEVTVPLSELLAGCSVAHDDSFTVSKRVSYQVVRKKTDSEEEEEDGADGGSGVLNLSYRFLRIMDTLRPSTATAEYHPPSFTTPPMLRPGTDTKTKVAAFVGALFTSLGSF